MFTKSQIINFSASDLKNHLSNIILNKKNEFSYLSLDWSGFDDFLHLELNTFILEVKSNIENSEYYEDKYLEELISNIINEYINDYITNYANHGAHILISEYITNRIIFTDNFNVNYKKFMELCTFIKKVANNTDVEFICSVIRENEQLNKFLSQYVVNLQKQEANHEFSCAEEELFIRAYCMMNGIDLFDRDLDHFDAILEKYNIKTYYSTDDYQSTDALTNILATAKNKKVLSRYDERKLLEQIKKASNPDAMRIFFEHNLRLIIYIAAKFRGRGLDFVDLIQEGYFGFEKAVLKFDFSFNCKFSTYAYQWIYQSITRALADNARTIRIPVHLQENLNVFSARVESLKREIGREPTVEEISDFTHLPVSTVDYYLLLFQKTTSLNITVGDDKERELENFVIDERTGVEEETILTVLSDEISQLFDSADLSKKQRYILIRRFGLDGSEESTLQEIGKNLKITRERVRQIEQKAIRKLINCSKIKSFAVYMDNEDEAIRTIDRLRKEHSKKIKDKQPTLSGGKKNRSKKGKSFYELSGLSSFNSEEIDSIIYALSDEDVNLLKRKYPNGFQNVSSMVGLTKEDNDKICNIINKMKKCLNNPECLNIAQQNYISGIKIPIDSIIPKSGRKNNDHIFSYFLRFPKDDVITVINSLDATKIDILKKAYGEDFKSVFNAEVLDDTETNQLKKLIIPNIRRRLLSGKYIETEVFSLGNNPWGSGNKRKHDGRSVSIKQKTSKNKKSAFTHTTSDNKKNHISNRNKNFYSSKMFANFTREEIDRAIGMLPDSEVELLKKKYPNGFENLSVNEKLLDSEKAKIVRIMQKMNNYLSGKIRKKRSNMSDIPKKEGCRKYKDLFSRFPGYCREDIIAIIPSLSVDSIAILKKQYGENFDLVPKTNNLSTEEAKKLSTSIILIMKRKLKRVAKYRRTVGDESVDTKFSIKTSAQSKCLYDISLFSGFKKEEIDAAIHILSDEDKALLHKKYPNGFDHFSDSTNLTEAEKQCIKNSVIKRISAILHSSETLSKAQYNYKNGIQNSDKLFGFRKHKGLFERIGGYEKDEILLAINSLPKESIEILTAAYGTDFTSIPTADSLTAIQSRKLNSSIIPGINRRLRSKEFKSFVSRGTPDEKDVSYQEFTFRKSFYDSKVFKGFSRDEIAAAIGMLPIQDRDLLHKKYPNGFDQLSDDESLTQKEKRRIDFTIKQNIKNILNDPETLNIALNNYKNGIECTELNSKNKKYKDLFSRFPEYSRQEILAIIPTLSSKYINILETVYGKNFDLVPTPETLNGDISRALSSSVIPIMKRALKKDKNYKNVNGQLEVFTLEKKTNLAPPQTTEIFTKKERLLIKKDVIKSEAYKQVSSIFPHIEAMIICLRLGVLEQKCYTIKEISEILEISEKDINKRVLTALRDYKDYVVSKTNFLEHAFTDGESEPELKKLPKWQKKSDIN